MGRQGYMTDDSAGTLFPCFSPESHSEQFWHGQGCPPFYVVHPAFPLPPTASSALEDALKDDFWRGCRGVWRALTSVSGSSRTAYARRRDNKKSK